jgi:hypothetical protein
MHIVPRVIYLTLGLQHGAEQLPRLGRDMTAGGRFVVCVVHPSTAELTVNIAREVPVKVGAGPRDSRIRRLGDNPETLLVNFLEHKGSVVSAEIPTRIIKRVRSAVKNRKSLGVDELGEIVVIAMDDNGTLADVRTANVPAMKTIRRLPTNALSESESKETDSSHEKEDKADKSDLFSPRSLPFRAPQALGKTK